jgi:hypothetical protein
MSVDGESTGGAMAVDDGFSDDEDDDPFKGLEDLKDETMAPSRPQTAVRHAVPPPLHDTNNNPLNQSGNQNSSTPTNSQAAGLQPQDTFDVPPPVCEEFDLGPEFIRRQREEEAVWAKRVSPWILPDGPAVLGDEWRWAIRDIGRGSDSLRSRW